MSRRPVKVYIRDQKKVFRAVEGLTYGSTFFFVDKQMYTLHAGKFANPFDYVFEKVK